VKTVNATGGIEEKKKEKVKREKREAIIILWRKKIDTGQVVGVASCTRGENSWGRKRPDKKIKCMRVGLFGFSSCPNQ
jgi:hypothetical protein